MSKRTKHLGSSLDSFLAEEGCLDEMTAIALKEVLAWQMQEAMTSKGLSKVKMADQMNTSRSQVDRLLDPKSGNVTLSTMQKAARVLGKRLHVSLVDGPQAKKASVKHNIAKAGSAHMPRATARHRGGKIVRTAAARLKKNG